MVWRQEGQRYPLTVGLFVFTSDARLSVNFNRYTNVWSLLIHDVQPDDSGIYQCQVIVNSSTAFDYNVQLNVEGM